MLTTTVKTVRVFLAAAICAAVATSLIPSSSARAAQGDINIAVIDATVDPAQEQADQKVLDTAFEAFGAGGFPALTEHIDAVKVVAERAPRSYGLFERRGSMVIVRELPGVNTLGITLTVTMMGAGTVVAGPNTYGFAFHILGSYANEVRKHADALQWLDRGLAMQPSNWMLHLEKAAALGSLGRHEDALASIQTALDLAPFLTDDTRARLFRNKGIQLIDLKRLNEAEDALCESIRLLPDNPIAKSELQYIARLRAGAESAPADIANQEQLQRSEQELRARQGGQAGAANSCRSI